ncbi:SusD/RagB family nutrient-binding outer membrane lipoprotein [uncultured Microscilla sp.]|uniref:SusD/RagB family nutrient-binding outer membrane lipoprotein n=1 Tax=uncultured Microscilla sp. TaxID=432653 RepID=UPI00261F46EB|nr:SusD/RagB family nutrient-binding outer membrane lipoprotein [uncultured Microscilla sp.]
MKIFKYIFLSLFVVSSLTGCNNWINTNDAVVSPNAGVDAPPAIILTHLQTATISVQEGNNARYANMFTQHFRGLLRQHLTYDGYGLTNQNFQWGIEYQEIIHQANIVIEKANATGDKVLVGIAKIMKAWTFGSLTALYGDIPFTEADNLEKFPNPKYDDQVTVVYPGVIALLNEGIADLGAGGSATTGDIFFKDGATQIANWIAAANTLKARFQLHLAASNNDYASVITSATSGISAVANNVMAPHAGTTLKDANLYWDFLTNQRGGDYGATGSFLEALIKTGGAKNNAKTNESARYADIFSSSDDINTTTSTIFGASASFPLVTYEENQLILAEANARLGNDAAALTALNNVRAALAAKYTAGTYTAYVSTDTEVATNAALLAEIIRERYCTLVGQVEVFNDVRRTDNAIGLTPTTGTALIARFIYPLVEDQSNSSTPKGIGLFEKVKVFGGTK